MPLRGVPMIRRVVDSLRGSQEIGRIVVCGPADLANWVGTEVVPTSGSPAGSVAAFLESGTHQWPLLVTTADHPLLKSEMIDFFCRETRGAGADLTVGMASKTTIAAAYPATRRTFYRFRDDQWGGCNIFGLTSPNVLELVHFWRSLEDHRKRPLKIVRRFGWRNLIGMLMRRWTAQEAVARAGHRFGVSARPIPMPWAEAAIDVDTLEDLVLVDSIIAQQERVTAGS